MASVVSWTRDRWISSQRIRDWTEGRGVDVVLNCLAGEFIDASLSVLSPGGRFLEIGKTGIWDAERMARCRPDVRYWTIDMIRVCRERPAWVQAALAQAREWCDGGKFRAPPTTVFRIEEAVRAFRFMQQARHVGKIVLEARDEDATDAGPLRFRGDATYLITGGLGGLGLLVAGWLVQRGARHIALLSRRGPTPEAVAVLEGLRRAGAEVRVWEADVGDEAALMAVWKSLQLTMPPLRGVIHSAGTLDDGVLAQQSWEKFSRVFRPKVEGAWNLHRLSRGIPLDFFVLFSSAASLLGSPGQANHAAANAFLDALAHARRAAGLPALSINWGAWSQVGAASKRALDARAGLEALRTIAPEEGLAVLEQLLRRQDAQVGAVPLDWSLMRQRHGQLMFIQDFVQTPEFSRERASAFLEELRKALPQERRALVLAHVQSQVATVLDVSPPSRISADQGFFELGLDSLTSIELRNRLQNSFACRLPTTLVFDYPNIHAFVDHLCRRVIPLEFGTGPAPGTEIELARPAGDSPPEEARLDDLTFGELETMLNAKLAEIEEEVE